MISASFVTGHSNGGGFHLLALGDARRPGQRRRAVRRAWLIRGDLKPKPMLHLAGRTTRW